MSGALPHAHTLHDVRRCRHFIVINDGVSTERNTWGTFALLLSRFLLLAVCSIKAITAAFSLAHAWWCVVFRSTVPPACLVLPCVVIIFRKMNMVDI